MSLQHLSVPFLGERNLQDRSGNVPVAVFVILPPEPALTEEAKMGQGQAGHWRWPSYTLMFLLNILRTSDGFNANFKKPADKQSLCDTYRTQRTSTAFPGGCCDLAPTLHFQSHLHDVATLSPAARLTHSRFLKAAWHLLPRFPPCVHTVPTT